MFHKRIFPLLLILFCICGAAARWWNLTAGVDAMGIPVSSHPSALLLSAISILAALVFLLCALASPCRGVTPEVLYYSGLQTASAFLGAVLLILYGFASMLILGGKLNSILGFMILLAGICLMLVAFSRKNHRTTHPALELLPVICLLVLLAVDFKHRSTDPIILDYCMLLFALTFALLALHRCCGFQFSLGKPRLTLFCSACACYFSAATVVDGILHASLSTLLLYAGILFWMLPLAFSLVKPSDAPKKTN